MKKQIKQITVRVYPIGQYDSENGTSLSVDSNDTFSLIDGSRYYEIVIEYTAGTVTYGFFTEIENVPRA